MKSKGTLRMAQKQLQARARRLTNDLRIAALKIHDGVANTEVAFRAAFSAAFPDVRAELQLEPLGCYGPDEPEWVLAFDFQLHFWGIGEMKATSLGWHPEPHEAKRIDDRWADVGVAIEDVVAFVTRFNESADHSCAVVFEPLEVQTASSITKITCVGDLKRFLADAYPTFEMVTYAQYRSTASLDPQYDEDEHYCVAGYADGEPVLFYGSGKTQHAVDTVMANIDLLYLQVPGVTRQVQPDAQIMGKLIGRTAVRIWGQTESWPRIHELAHHWGFSFDQNLTR